MAIGFVGMGSNVGDRRGALASALRRIGAAPCCLVNPDQDAASLYETAALGVGGVQGAYFNTVVRVDTSLSAADLFGACQRIEREIEPGGHKHNGPRRIDLDLLFFASRSTPPEQGCAVLVSGIDDGLILPHPRLHLRRFVLVPMLELAPEFVHPRLGKSLADLERDLRGVEGQETLLAAGRGWWVA